MCASFASSRGSLAAGSGSSLLAAGFHSASAACAEDEDGQGAMTGSDAAAAASLPIGLLPSASDDGREAAEAAVAAVFRSDESDSDSRSSGSQSLAISAAAAERDASNSFASAAATFGRKADGARSSADAFSSIETGGAAPSPLPTDVAVDSIAPAATSSAADSASIAAGSDTASAAPAPAAVLSRLARVHFLCQDFVEGGGGGSRGGGAVTIPPASFDVVTLFNVTKYVHLNGGDEAVRSLLSRAHAALRPGGRLLLIAQDWESYGRSRHLCVGFSAQYGRIRFKPADFLSFLLEEVGFRRLHAAVRVRKPASRHGTSQLLVLEK